MSDGHVEMGDEAPSKSMVSSSSATAGITGTSGIAIVLNAIILSFVDEKSVSNWLTITPVISGAVVWVTSYLWKSFGEDPVRNKNLRILKQRCDRAQQDMRDEDLSEAARDKARQDYESSRETMRNI